MRNTTKLDDLTLGESIANLNRAMIMQTNNISGHRFLYRNSLPSLKAKGI